MHSLTHPEGRYKLDRFNHCLHSLLQDCAVLGMLQPHKEEIYALLVPAACAAREPSGLVP